MTINTNLRSRLGRENFLQGKVFLFLAILILCFIVRFFCLLKSSWIRPVLDEIKYVDIARAIVDSGSYPGSFRPPGYPFFMAGLAFLGVNNLPLATKWVQIFLSIITCAVLMEIARRAFDEKAAIVSGFLYALYPNLAVFSTFLWSESFFIALLVPAVALLLRGESEGKRRCIAAAGFLMGLAALTRTTILYFLPGVLYWLWRNPRWKPGQRLRMGGIFFAFMVLSVSPWTLRNYFVHNRFVPIDTNGGFNFFLGNYSPMATWNKNNFWSSYYRYQYHSFSKDEVERDRIGFLKGLKEIRQEPGIFFKKSFLQAFYLWTMDSFVLRHLRNGWYGKTSLFRIRAATFLVVGFYFLVISTAMGGLLLAPPGRLKELTLLLVGYYTLIHGITFGLSRHRLPLLPFLIVFSAYFMVEIAKIKRIPQKGGFRKKWLAALAAALLIWGYTFPIIMDTWKTGGKGYIFHIMVVEGTFSPPLVNWVPKNNNIEMNNESLYRKN